MLWLAKLMNPTVLVVENGRAFAAKGNLSRSKLEDLGEILSGHSIMKGRIYINGAQRCSFSSSIPPEAHQQLRNVLIGL